MSDDARQAFDLGSYLWSLVPPAWVTVISGAGAVWAAIDKSGTLKSLFTAPKQILAKQESEEADRRKLRDELVAEKKNLREELDRKHATVIARLDAQDEVLSSRAVTLKNIQAEVTTNGGGSLKDIAIATHQMAVVTSARTRLIQANANIAIFECDGDTGACVWVNEACCRLYDLPSDRMLGWGWLSAVEPTERETVKREWLASVRGDYPYAWTYNVIRKNGLERLAITAKAERLVDRSGKVLLFQGTVKIKGEV